MYKKFSFLFIVMIFLLLLISQNSFATTSCTPEFTFIGFSKGMDAAYFEGEYAGECTASLVLYKYDPKTNPSVSTAEKFDMAENEIPDWDFALVQGKDVANNNRKIREAAKKRFWKTKYFPEMVWDQSPAKASFTTKNIAQTIWFLKKPVTMPATIIRLNDKQCFFPTFSPVYVEKEMYLAGHGDIVSAHYLSVGDSWIIVRKHPNIGDTGHTADSVSIYKMKDCKEGI